MWLYQGILQKQQVMSCPIAQMKIDNTPIIWHEKIVSEQTVVYCNETINPVNNTDRNISIMKDCIPIFKSIGMRMHQPPIRRN